MKLIYQIQNNPILADIRGLWPSLFSNYAAEAFEAPNVL